MQLRLARLVSSLLAVLFFGQPLALIGLVEQLATPAQCCKNSCCCRRAHGKSGPAMAATPGCGQACHVAAQNISRLQGAAPPASAVASLNFVTSSPIAYRSASFRTDTHRSLYQRPPPSLT